MPVNVVSTIKGLCKRCFSCIRHCPAKAIKVEDGQATVVWEYCIGCGHCVQVCSQNAKIILSGIEKAEQALKTEKPIACLAPSFVAQYSQYHPGQVISAVKKLGFTEVWEVAFGAYLVTQAYQKHVLSDQEKPYYISTSCPAIINMVEKHYPEFIPYLVPIVSPMIALGRYLKKTFGDRCRVVFIGPCVAKKDEAEDVRKLLTFPEESAGGIMNTEFVSLPVDLTAGQAITRIRETANDAETIYYLYVTDESDHLLGVFSLRQLVMANPKSHIKDFMETHLITVDLTDNQDHCAQIISKYNLLAVPVVDKNNVLHGIVTADDALDKIIPTAWKKRLPKLYH